MRSIRSRKGSLKESNLYLVLDTQVAAAAALLRIAEEASAAGADIIQLRDKISNDGEYVALANELIRRIGGKSLFIINDRVHLADNIAADGIHLGQDDMSLRKARKILGPEMLIGRSCQDLAHIKEALVQGADYIGFGSVFPTQTKPERQAMDLALLQEAVRCSELPLFAIGGITLENIETVVDRGVSRVAVTRAVCEAGDVRKVVGEFKEALNAGVVHPGFL